VPLGIELKSEQHLEEMIDILVSLHKYVPTISTTEEVVVNGKSVEVIEDKFSQVLLGQYIYPIVRAYVYNTVEPVLWLLV